MDKWTEGYIQKAIKNLDVSKDLFVDEIVGSRSATINSMQKVLCAMKMQFLEKAKKDPKKKSACELSIKVLELFEKEFDHVQRNTIF